MNNYRKSAILITLACIVFAGGSQLDAFQSKNANVVYAPSHYGDLSYRNIGPTRGGRVTAVAGIASQPATFYMGATGGGVWKTTDYGQNWKNVSDGFFATPSIGAIRVSKSDPDIVYVGTGSDGLRSNVISGRGVYKSTDAGKTWAFMGLPDVGQIGAVEIHPTNPDLVYVAAIGHPFGPSSDRGVYRSRDGGKKWEKILFISDTTGAVDLEFAPDDPTTIYASIWRGERKPWTIISGGDEGGIYKSTDGGDNWTKLTTGLPTGLVGKSDLAVSAADPNRVYALMEAGDGQGGLYRSNDRGESFTRISDYSRLYERPFYYTNVDADPSDANAVYVSSTSWFKSIDGGKTWKRRSTPHGDNHDMWINPNDPDLFIQSNDGGANVTRDGGKTWSTQTNQSTAEIYQVNVDDQFPYWVYGGQQDNSTIAVPSLPPYNAPAGNNSFWISVGGCETGPAVPKPGNHNIVYSNCKGRFGRYNKLTGQEQQFYVGATNIYGHNPANLKYRFQRVAPIHVSPHNPDVVYHASQFLHKSTDDGETWETISPDLTAFEADKQVISGSPITRDITGEEYYSTIYAIQESPITEGVIWVGANDGPIHITRDGGKTWTDVTPRGLPPGGRVQTIEPSPHKPGKAYAAIYRYLLDDWRPYIYRTTNYGKSWKLLTNGKNGIPDNVPTRVIREDPDKAGLLYAGTEVGMYISFDDGKRWQSFQQNLPVTPITDIKIHRKDLILSTMGRGFWIMDNVTLLHQLTKKVSRAKSHLYTPKAAYRLRYRATGKNAIPSYPRIGASIDYFIGQSNKQPVKLDIYDSEGILIRAFSSDSVRKHIALPENIALDGLTLVSAGTPVLDATPGMHRFNWNLLHAGAWAADSGRSGSRGPFVKPGSYQVRFTVGKITRTVQLEVLLDPRVVADNVTQADVTAQEQLSLRVRNAISRARIIEAQIKAARKGLRESNPEKDAALARIESVFVTPKIIYPRQMLTSQLGYLYSMISRADQRPGKDAYDRLAELNGLLNEATENFQKLTEE